MSRTAGPEGAHLSLHWQVIDNNVDTYRCLLEFTLTNRGECDLPASGWAIYFNGVNRPAPGTSTGGARVEYVKGDVFRIVPGEDFGALAPGSARAIRYVGSTWAIQRTDAPRGAYLLYDDGTPHARASAIGDPIVAPFVRPEQLTRNATDKVPHYDAALAFADNAPLSLLPAEQVARITPTPCSFEMARGEFTITAETLIVHGSALLAEALFLRAALREVTGQSVALSRVPSPRSISLELDPSLEAPRSRPSREAYRLSVTPAGIAIIGATAEAVFRGVQSLRQLLPIHVWQNPAPTVKVSCCTVADEPRYSYRGMHLDVARNFSSKETLLRLLDVMALYKLNQLHLHLTDDEGWRIEIPSLPELTAHGSRRGFSPGEADCLPPSFGSGPSGHSAGSGYYSRADFLDILRFATERHISVIPEVDVPGHARAAIKAMEARYRRLMTEGRAAEADAHLLTDFQDESRYVSEQGWHDNVICVGLESCYRFIDTVVRELKDMFVEAGAPLRAIHVGGDEMPAGCWEHSPKCRAFMQQQGLVTLQDLRDVFYERLRGILASYDLALAGWEEIALLRAAKKDLSVKPNPKFVGKNFLPYVWNNAITGSPHGLAREDVAYRLANAGYEVVLCSVANLYFDFAYEKTPEEPGYYWGGFINARKVFEFCPTDPFLTATTKLFGEPIEPEFVARMERLKPEAEPRMLGVQGQLWGENLRSAADLEYFAMPRLVPLAERAWAREPNWRALTPGATRDARITSDWNEFANRLGQRELPRLDGFLGGYGYRVPVPGAVIRAGVLYANVCAPGLVLRYATDGSEPTSASPVYREPVPAEQAKVAAFTSSGRKGRTVTAKCA